MTTAELPAPARAPRLRPLVSAWVKAGKRRWAVARSWRIHAALPGVAGAGLISAGVAVRFGIWAGLICGGVFCLLFDHRMS